MNAYSFTGTLSNPNYIRNQNWTNCDKIIYVENIKDRRFWKKVLRLDSSYNYNFCIVENDKNTIKTGKGAFKKVYSILNSNTLVIQDSDYNYLIDIDAEFYDALRNNPFVIHTYAYGRENLLFSILLVNKFVDFCQRNHEINLDFNDLLNDYAKLCHKINGIWMYFEKYKNFHKYTFDLNKYCEYNELIDSSIAHISLPFIPFLSIDFKKIDNNFHIDNEYWRLFQQRVDDLEQEIREKLDEKDLNNYNNFFSYLEMEEFYLINQAYLYLPCHQFYTHFIEKFFKKIKDIIVNVEAINLNSMNLEEERCKNLIKEARNDMKEIDIGTWLLNSCDELKVEKLLMQIQHDFDCANNIENLNSCPNSPK